MTHQAKDCPVSIHGQESGPEPLGRDLLHKYSLSRGTEKGSVSKSGKSSLKVSSENPQLTRLTSVVLR